MLEILGKIGFDWHLALANLVNFVVVFLVLKKMFFAPIESAIASRQARVSSDLKSAEEAKSALEEALKQKTEILIEAKTEAGLIVDSAIQKSKAVESEALSKTEAEIVDKKQKALQEIALAEVEMRKKIEAEATELAILSARKIIGAESAENKENFARKMAKN